VLAEERLSEETREAVDQFVAEGREAFRARQYATAARRFEQALELDPASELAASYLELARERQPRGRGARAAGPQPTPAPRVAASGGSEPAQPAPTPGSARITISFNSPIPRGQILVTADGATVAEISFDFTTKGFLGLRRGGSGVVKRVVLMPSGNRTISATLLDDAGVLLGAKTFERHLPAGSDWTLKFDLPSKNAQAAVFLVKVAG
jgi:hypothetical protein